MESKQPLISIIIVNFNGKLYLEKCLESLMKIDYSNYEIIVIDNNSSDDSILFLEKNYSKIIIKKLEKNNGFAYPNNLGAKLASGEFLLFLNNDTIVSPSFLSELLTTITSDSKIAICQSLLLKTNGDVDSSGDFVDTLGRAFSSREKNPNFKQILSARGACMLIKKKIFFELEGFDEKFFVSFEDVDLGWRAWLSGYKVFVVPKSTVIHHSGKTISKLKNEIQFHSSKNTLILRLTNFETIISIKSIVALFLITFFKRFFKINIVPDPEEPPQLPYIYTILKAINWIMKNWSYIISKRKKIRSIRKLSTKDLIKLGIIKSKLN